MRLTAKLWIAHTKLLQAGDWQPCLKVPVTFQLFQTFKITMYSIIMVKSVLLATNLVLKVSLESSGHNGTNKVSIYYL